MLYLCQLSSSLYLEEHFSKFSMKVMKVTKPEKEMFSCLNLKILSAPKKIVRECLQFTIFFFLFWRDICGLCRYNARARGLLLSKDRAFVLARKRCRGPQIPKTETDRLMSLMTIVFGANRRKQTEAKLGKDVRATVNS